MSSGGTVRNGGLIAGGAEGAHSFGAGDAGGSGIVMSAGGTVSNSGSVTGGAGAANSYRYVIVNGGPGGTGIVMSAGGTVINSGAISGGAGGASVFGQAGAAGTGIVMTAGGTVINGSKTSATASISGQVGVYAGPTGAATVTSFGTIQGLGGTAVQFRSAGDRLIAEAGSTWIGAVAGGGGTLELGSGTGTITGLGATGMISGAEAMTFSGFGGYQLDTGTSWTLTGPSVIKGGGSLSDRGAVTQTGDLTIGDATAAASTLTIAKGATWTLGGASGIAGGTGAASSIIDGGTLTASAGSGVSVVGVKVAQASSGLIEAASGTLDLQDAIAGTGTLRVDAGAVLEVDATVAPGVTINFNGAGATLEIGNLTAFRATVSGFAVGDTIDLLGQAATGAKVNKSDQLVIVNGATTVARLQLTGSYTGATFSVGSDGRGGASVTLLTLASAPPTSPSAFVSAMAGLGAAPAGSSVRLDTAEAVRPTLLTPRGS